MRRDPVDRAASQLGVGEVEQPALLLWRDFRAALALAFAMPFLGHDPKRDLLGKLGGTAIPVLIPFDFVTRDIEDQGVASRLQRIRSNNIAL